MGNVLRLLLPLTLELNITLALHLLQHLKPQKVQKISAPHSLHFDFIKCLSLQQRSIKTYTLLNLLSQQ